MATISTGTETLTPDLVLGWDTARTSKTVQHDVIDNPEPVVVLRSPRTRSGTLSLFFVSLADALTAVDLHSGFNLFTFDGAPQEPGLTLTYVVTDPGVRLSSEGDEHTRWRVEIGYREVAL